MVLSFDELDDPEEHPTSVTRERAIMLNARAKSAFLCERVFNMVIPFL